MLQPHIYNSRGADCWCLNYYIRNITMFALDTVIDTIQSTKKQFVTTFVTDKELQKPLFAFVDAQTDFVKQIVKTNEVLANQAKDSFTKALKV